MERAEVVVVGGAAMGSSLAYFLTSNPAFQGRVTVVEKDPSYANCATARSAGSIRQQFSTPENIAMSLFGIDFLRAADTHLGVAGEGPGIGLKEGGYLFLASEAGLPVLQANSARQRAMGADNVLLDPAGLAERFPWLEVGDLAGGCLGLTMEGWFDPYALLQGYRRKARSQGAHYIEGEVVGLEREGERVTAVTLADGKRLAADIVVNAAGLWGREVAAMAGITLPLSPRKRLVFVLDCRTPLPDCPLLIDPSGVYVRPEGATFICGLAPEEAADPETRDFEIDHGFFEEEIWPKLAARIPAMEAIKVVNAWAGHYDLNLFDQNAILGPDPAVPNFYMANGFSGHGIQQSPAVGRGLAELIIEGRYTSLDLSRFSPTRLAKGEAIIEENVV